MSEEDKLLELANWLDAESRLRELLAERLLQAVPESVPAGRQRLAAEQLSAAATSLRRLREALSWALDQIDLYDEELLRQGEPPDKVNSPIHLAAKSIARAALTKNGVSA